MDDDPGVPLTWGPNRLSAVILAAAGLAVGTAAVAAGAAGRVLLITAAAGLLAAAGLAAGWGDAVSADEQGVVVRGGWTRRHLDWSEVASVRADLRRRSRGLEIDTGEELLVVPSWLLGGAEPALVARRLQALLLAAGRRSAGGGPGSGG